LIKPNHDRIPINIAVLSVVCPNLVWLDLECGHADHRIEPIQMATLPRRDNPLLRPLLPLLSHFLSRPGRRHSSMNRYEPLTKQSTEAVTLHFWESSRARVGANWFGCMWALPWMKWTLGMRRPTKK